MMTDVVVAPSLGRLLVGCVLLLTGTVLVVVVVPTVWGGEVVPTVWEGMVPLKIDAVGMKYISNGQKHNTHNTKTCEIDNHINFALQWYTN